jgi:hypothetical protein
VLIQLASRVLHGSPAPLRYFQSRRDALTMRRQRIHKPSDKSRDFICRRIQREMTTIDNVDLSIGYITLIGFRFGGVKR